MFSWAKSPAQAIAVAAVVAASLMACTESTEQSATKAATPQYSDALSEFGREATAEELAAWDIDVRPDFAGLPDGAGDAYTGEEIWLEKCALCHGDFGDSNEIFSPLALGNITDADIESGHVAALMNRAAVRTTLMKVATVSTLWDYINRAMPWNAPKTLSADEVYSLVAYLLSLGYIIEPDFELNQDSIHEAQARMPNRNGMTTEHGLWSVSGTPDVQGSQCVSDCDVDTTVSSSIPEYAMNAHGNLKDQMRDYSPYPGMQTAPVDDAAEPEVEATNPTDLLAANGCLACHQMDKALVGPAFNAIREKYQGQSDAVAYLSGKIRAGGSGVWGSMPMPPMAQVDDAALATIATWLAE
jgi:cytochrome c551/c552